MHMVYVRKYLVLDTFIISPEEFYFEKEKKNFFRWNFLSKRWCFVYMMLVDSDLTVENGSNFLIVSTQLFFVLILPPIYKSEMELASFWNPSNCFQQLLTVKSSLTLRWLHFWVKSTYFRYKILYINLHTYVQKKWSIFLIGFQEKVKTTPITIAFSDYTGPQDYHPSIQYIARKFKEQKKSGPQAYCHLTCITDTNNMRFVINAVTDLLIKNFLKDCGIY